MIKKLLTIVIFFATRFALAQCSCSNPDPFVLNVPTGAQVRASEIDLSWTDSNKATHYRVFYKLGSSGWLEGCSTLEPVRNCRVQGLTAGATYTFKVESSYECLDGEDNPCGVFAENETPSRNITTDPPAVPASLSNSDVTTTSFKANWSDVPGVVNYTIEVFHGAANIFTTTSATRNKTISSLTAGNTYSWRVRANGADADSEFANGITVALKPLAPSDLAASGHTTSSFTASWDPVNGAESYKLEVSTANNFSNLLLDATVTGTAKAVSGLNPGTTYHYRVRASNEGVFSAYSNHASTITVSLSPLATAAANVTKNSFTAKWNAITGAATYKLDVSRDNFQTFIHQDISVNSGLQHSVTGLSEGATYQYRLRAVNAGGTSDNSNPIEVRLIPARPALAAASGITQTSFTASWAAVTGAAEYRLDVSADNFVTRLTGYDNRTVTTTSEGVTGLAPGAVYQLRVRASNPSGASADSDPESVALVPANAVADAASAIGQTSFTANWEATPGAAGYRLDVSADNFSTFISGYNDRPVTGTSHAVVTQLAAGNTYQYRLRAVNASGVSSHANIATVILVPANPVTTAPDGISQNAFTATWSTVPGAAAYRLDVSADHFVTLLAGYANLAVTGNAVTVTGLPENGTFQYRVRAVNASGVSGNSNAATVTLSPQNPQVMDAADITQTSFIAHWQPVASASAYYLDVSEDNFATFVDGYENLVVDGTSKLVTGLREGTACFYRVRALNGSGLSGYSASKQVITIPSAPVLDAPADLSKNGFTISWTACTGADKYRLDVASNNTFTNYVAHYQNREVSTTSENITGLSPGLVYYVRVRAFNVSGVSPYSVFKTQVTVPEAPLNLQAIEKHNNRFIAGWVPAAGAVFYELEVAADAAFSNRLPGYAPRKVTGATELVVEGLEPSTIYYVRIRSGNEAGISAYSGSKPVNTSNANGVDDFELKVEAPAYDPAFAPGDEITLKVRGGVGSKSVIMRYRPIASKEFNEITPVSDLDQYKISVDESWLDALGLEFFFIVSDESGQQRTTATQYIHRDVTDAAIPVSGSGGKLKDYRIIALPYTVGDGIIENIMEPLLGGYDKAKWRLLRYQGGKNVDYNAGLSKTRMERGHGYWFNTTSPVKHLQLREASMPDNTQAAPFQLALQQGWNQIGNPYPFDIFWQNVLDHNDSPAGAGNLLTYDPETISLSESGVLRAFEGGFVWADAATTVKVPVTAGKPVVSGRASARANEHAPGTWIVPVTVRQGEMVTTMSGFGMHPGAGEGKDRFDVPVAPRFVRFLELKSFREKQGIALSKDVVGIADQYTWLFTLDHNAHGPVTLQWTAGELQEGALLLHDTRDQLIVDMKGTEEYTFQGAPRSFRIYFNRRAIAYGNGESVQRLGQPFPNPAKEQITIPYAFTQHASVCNARMIVRSAAGIPVADFTAGSETAGIHHLQWDMKTPGGERLPAGLYFFELFPAQGETACFRGRIIVQ